MRNSFEKQKRPLKGFNLAKQSIQFRNSYLEKARSKAIDLARCRPTKLKLSPLHSRRLLPHSIYSFIVNRTQEYNRVCVLTSVKCNAILHYWSSFDMRSLRSYTVHFLVSSRPRGSLFRITRSWSRKRGLLPFWLYFWVIIKLTLGFWDVK